MMYQDLLALTETSMYVRSMYVITVLNDRYCRKRRPRLLHVTSMTLNIIHTICVRNIHTMPLDLPLHVSVPGSLQVGCEGSRFACFFVQRSGEVAKHWLCGPVSNRNDSSNAQPNPVHFHLLPPHHFVVCSARVPAWWCRLAAPHVTGYDG